MTELFVEKGTAVAVTARHQDKLDAAVKGIRQKGVFTESKGCRMFR
ncbi:MAG TPA: hypothetical protein IAA06_04250 [Candidatus Blautia faecavium]|uniref:Uncharacterized protein n=1 Tax=Candidatus Blautia faecavium TaxID=2838487 RepID=A0A9D2RV87_9FIRM|nr:hypothetical protein [Candidatus Blautia faecavium]